MNIIKSASICTIMLCNIAMAQTGLDAGMKIINEKSVEAQLEFLSSDWMEGRETGKKGGYLAADYIASVFKMAGLEPCGDKAWTNVTRKERMEGKHAVQYTSYFQDFALVELKSTDNHKLKLVTKEKEGISGTNFIYKTDFVAYYPEFSQEINAPVVFAGYGFQDKDKKYDDFKGIDIKGRIVMIMEGYPGHKDTASSAYKKYAPEGKYGDYYMRRDKINKAKEAGALGILIFDKNANIPSSWGNNYPFRYNYDFFEGDELPEHFYDSRLLLPKDTMENTSPVFQISGRLATEILKGTGIDLDKFEEEAMINYKSGSKIIKDKTIRLATKVETNIIRSRNVLGMLKGKDTTRSVVIGAHYDHVGKYNGYVYNGADDNASGTVAVMELARAFALSGEKPEMNIIFAAWTGEEKGLLGSEYFANNPVVPIEQIEFAVNYDMISRDEKDDTLKNKVDLTYSMEHPEYESISGEICTGFELNLDVNYKAKKNPGGGSDFASFSKKNIPILTYMAGMHEDYHTPFDHVDKTNIPKMTAIIKLGYGTIWELMERVIE